MYLERFVFHCFIFSVLFRFVVGGVKIEIETISKYIEAIERRTERCNNRNAKDTSCTLHNSQIKAINYFFLSISLGGDLVDLVCFSVSDKTSI